MNKAVIGIVVSIIAVVGIVGVVAINQKDNNTKTTTTNQHDGMAEMQTEGATTSNNPPSQQTSEVQSGEVTMDIKDFAYAKPNIKVKKGTKVVWINQDNVKHDVTPDSESADFKTSELLGKGESYSFTFTTTGTYTYHCSPHPYMKGSVEVVE
jgi:amicyanin